MIIDTTGAARRADHEREREWLAEQRVFISSAMADTGSQRKVVAEAVTDEGARAVWFEEFGRDADAEEAYVAEVDAATIYLGIANEQYGRFNAPHGFSATELEYMRAREGGKRVGFFAAAQAPGREGHLNRFLERVRFDITTEDYSNVSDLDRRVRRRLHDLAAESLSPWVKVGALVFRADEIDDTGEAIMISGRVSEEIAHQLEVLRDRQHGRTRLRCTYGSRVADGDVGAVRRTIKGGNSQITVSLERVEGVAANSMRPGTSNLSAADLVEVGMRLLFLGEPLSTSLHMMESLTETGINGGDLQQVFQQPNEIAEGIARVVVADGLVGSGAAERLLSVRVGPRHRDLRRISLQWEDRSLYDNVQPHFRRIEGDWKYSTFESGEPSRPRRSGR